MELLHLRNFLAVARLENMTRAASQLHISQPTLSRHISILEQELQNKLFKRHSFSMQLTPAGKLLQERAGTLLDMADKIKAEFNGLINTAEGDLYFGMAESYQIGYVAQQIREMQKTRPNLRYHITSGDTEQVLGKLDNGLLDFAVLCEQPNTSLYHSVMLPGKDTWGLIVPKGEPLASKDRITFDDLLGQPLFCSEQSWRLDIPRWCGERISELNLAGSFRLAYNGAIFVKEGLGYLLTFDHLIDTSVENGLCFRPLYPELISRLYIVWTGSRSMTATAREFLKHIT